MLRLLLGSAGSSARQDGDAGWVRRLLGGRYPTRSNVVVDEDIALTCSAVWCCTLDDNADGHAPQIEKPGLVNQLISRYLRDRLLTIPSNLDAGRYLRQTREPLGAPSGSRPAWARHEL